MALTNLQLTPQFVQAVREAVDILEIAGAHAKLQRVGRKWKALCPFHKEKTPSFQLDPDQGLYYCFGCGKGGDAIKLHMELTGDDFPTAMEALARRFAVPIPAPAARRPGGGGKSETPRDLEAVLEAAAEFFTAALARDAAAQRYLRERRIPEELVTRYRLGYAPDGWRNLTQALHPKIAMADLLDAGLVGRPEGGGEPYDRFRNRLIFPIKNGTGRLVGFGGRTLGDDKAKYVNTAETDRFHKGSILFGLDSAKRAMRESGKALLVEGYFDQLAAVAAGVEGAVASMGTALTPEQAKLLARHAEEVIVAYDGDTAGEAAARRALPILLAEGLAVRRVRFAEGEDPDSLRLAKGEAALAAAVAGAEDLILLELDRLVPSDAHRNPHGRARAAKEVTALLAPVKDTVLRYSYGRIAAERLGLPPHLLLQRLGVGPKPLAEAFATPSEGAGPSPGRGAEEALLRCLLWIGDARRPAPSQEALPPEEAFDDPQLRNIYALFLALYREAGKLPGTADLRRRLSDGDGISDRASMLLLESVDSVGEPAPEMHLKGLWERWLDRQRADLNRELRRIELSGDQHRIEEILNELEAIKRRRYSAAPFSAE
ncbi:MAG: DNA primase [Thermoanaerobaculia bacterium]|jgi:DNA primase|nr:DNA primase [Thermoanaerobaculia bacterium]MBP9823631.1 DNA primase [Thermoanaerobaculia bacterium]